MIGLLSAPMPMTACKGSTERPWPNAMVTVFTSPQCFGTIGSRLSGSSVFTRSSWPNLRRNAWCAETPSERASMPAPMFDE